MKFAVLVVAAAGLGAVATVAVPTSVLEEGSSQMQVLGDRLGQIKLADLNPFRAVYDREMDEIRKGRTPEELGFSTSRVSVEPYSFASPGYDPQQFNRVNQRPMGRLPPDGPH